LLPLGRRWPRLRAAQILRLKTFRIWRRMALGIRNWRDRLCAILTISFPFRPFDSGESAPG